MRILTGLASTGEPRAILTTTEIFDAVHAA